MKLYCIISHTHWDREWYEPFECFRLRLMAMMDHLLDLLDEKPGFIFHLDAQTIVLEDYLALRPEMRETLVRHISRGALQVGPWYVQNDLFQTSGESTIRNLLAGIALAREFGQNPDSFVGYTPDHFGLISQLPQILHGFGMDALLFGRGRRCDAARGDCAEFHWKGADGTIILAVQMVDFYNNGQRFSSDPEKAWRFFRRQTGQLSNRLSVPCYLLMNGVDHLEAQEDLPEVIQGIRARLPEEDIVIQCTMHDYIQSLRKMLDSESKTLAVISGELRSGGDRMLCQGTVSSRTMLKRANATAERRLFLELEPLWSFMELHGFSFCPRDLAVRRYLTRLLLANQPHDSICGCSQDAVHRHMEDRNERFHEIADAVGAEAMNRLTRHMDHRAGRKDLLITCFQPLPWKRTAVLTLDFDSAAAHRMRNYVITDIHTGTPIPFTEISRERTERALRSPINLPGRIWVDRIRIQLMLELPAWGASQLVVSPKKESRPAAAPLRGENRFLKLEVTDDGQVNLWDKQQCQEYRNCLGIIDFGDFGDAYNWKRNPDEIPVEEKDFPAEVACLSDNEFETVYQIVRCLRLPAYGNRRKLTRSRKKKTMKLTTLLFIRKEQPYCECRMQFDNCIKDHLLAAVVRTGIAGNVTESGSVFDIVKRDNQADDPAMPRFDYEEPMRDFVALGDKTRRMALLTDGGTAFEHRRGKKGEIMLPLVRSNGYICAFFDMPHDTTWIVPGNQCQEEIQARFALAPGADAVTAVRLSAEFTTPVTVFSDSGDPALFHGGRPCVQGSDLEEIFTRPDQDHGLEVFSGSSFLEVTAGIWQYSAGKRAEDGDGWIVRLVNLSDRTVKDNIRFHPAIRKVQLCFPDERGFAVLPLRHSVAEVTASPKQIVTLRVQA